MRQRLIIFTLGVLLTLVVQAKGLFTMNPHEIENPNVEDKPWQEGGVQLPELPKDENLIEVDLEMSNSRFRYFLDPKSIHANLDDGTVQYTLVMISNSGGRNTVFESMRCDTLEQKSFAYLARNKWRQVARPEWRSIRGRRMVPYHKRLWDFYLCTGFPNSQPTTEQVISNLRNRNKGSYQGRF